MSDPDDLTPLEEATAEAVGLRRLDRAALFRETAEAATDTDAPFWAVLLLSGAIATLGLALNQTAVVIGAMLVAPLLGPLLGLALALAVGDGRLAVQTSATIVLGAAGVIALAAALTLALPFHTVTAEIAARTQPTLLDLAIAIASGLAGAVVTVSRGSRLSASIPGVAIAVALIPPLSVAGFGIGIGGWDLVRGSLLLFGANLAGIVLAAMVAFLLVGMHRRDVVEVARAWHKTGASTGLAARIESAKAASRLRVFESTGLRLGLVLAFVLAVAAPLSTSLARIVRETRVTAAVDAATGALTRDGRAFVLGQDLTLGTGRATVRLRLATAAPLAPDARARVEAQATAAAGEPVAFVLEQVPTSSGDLDALAAAFPRGAPDAAPVSAPAPASASPSAPPSASARLDGVLASLSVPDSVAVVGGALGQGGTLTVTYLAPRRLTPDAEAMLARQAARGVGADPNRARVEAVLTGPQPLPADSAARAARLDAAAATARRLPGVRLAVTVDSAQVAPVRARLGSAADVRRGTPARFSFSPR